MADQSIKTVGDKVRLLRTQMEAGGVQAYLVPRADEWQGEYVPESAERLAWLTGFTGSAGQALVGVEKAAVFSDNRYTEQMKVQLAEGVFEGREAKEGDMPADWLCAHVPAGGKVGYDPRVHTVREIQGMQKSLAKKQITLVSVSENLVDAVWADRPAHPDAPARAYSVAYAGEESSSKINSIQSFLKKKRAQSLLLTMPDSIAWLLNIRGNDVPHVPVVLSYALVDAEGGVDWFVPAGKVGDDVRAHVGESVKIHDLNEIESVLKQRCEQAARAGKPVLLDERTASVWFRDFLKGAGASVRHADNPVIARRAIKNAVEQAHIRQAHVKDGVALTKFWKWIDEETPKGGLTELDAVAKLQELRGAQEGYQDDSFDAIVGWADHGAIVHYRSDEKSNVTITKDSLLLVDSGGQYLGGTTDNTRTRAIGTPTPEMREMFTRVLKGHIAVASARFDDGTTGRDLDVLARQFLKKTGLNYGHGTGHGVGAYLSVHEAGAGISPRFDKPLKPGMLVSNEPGYYKARAYGIRIESLVLVEETGDKNLKYKFNTVSLTPIDRKLIDVDLLDRDEIDWLNGYHQEVYEKLSPHLAPDEKEWLKKETAPLARPRGP